MKHDRFTYLVLLGSLAITSGCRCKPQAREAWAPRAAVQWSQVSIVGAMPAANTYAILSSKPTTGLFPTNLGVTRIAINEAKSETASTNEPILYSDPRNEFLRWNSTLDDQMAISEVFPVNQRDLGGGEAEPGQILAAFRGLHAQLGLIYAVNELSPDKTEMFGVLYETASSEPLVTLHAHAVSTTDPAEAKKAHDDPFTVWETDSRALVRARFAELVHTSVRELILRDYPAMMDAPAGWKPEASARPVAWPPRHRPSGGTR